MLGSLEMSGDELELTCNDSPLVSDLAGNDSDQEHGEISSMSSGHG